MLPVGMKQVRSTERKENQQISRAKDRKGKAQDSDDLKGISDFGKTKIWKAEIETKGKKASEEFEDVVFVTSRNAPVNQNDTDLVMKVISDRIAREHENLKPLTLQTLISEMSKFEAEDNEPCISQAKLVWSRAVAR